MFQRHQVLPICADVDRVMIDGVLVAAGLPLQGVARDRCQHTDAVVDARFDLGAFLVIVPSDQLQVGQLAAGIVKAIDLGKGL